MRIRILLPGMVLAACLGGIGVARADTITYNLDVYNSALSSFSGTAAQVLVSRTSSTSATITFSALTNTGPGGTFQVLMGDGGVADLNVAGAYTLGSVTELNSIVGFTPTFKDNTPGVVDGFGSFSLSLNNQDGFKDTATSITIALTAALGNSWGSAAAVLTANADGALAAIHAFECPQPCTINSAALATGYVANTGAIPVVEPGSIAMLGIGLLGLGIVRVRARRSSTIAPAA